MSSLSHLSPTKLDTWVSLELNPESLKNTTCPSDVLVIAEVPRKLSFLLECSPGDSCSQSFPEDARSLSLAFAFVRHVSLK